MEDVLTQFGAREVSPMDAYRTIFRLGEGYLQTAQEAAARGAAEPQGEPKANPIIIGRLDNGRVVRRVLYEDTFQETLEQFQDYQWAFMSGLTYWGNQNTGDAQSKAYALVFDLDGQTDKTLRAFLQPALGVGGYQVYPLPNYVALSGNNVHLYYVYDEPLDLYPNIKTQLKSFKYALTDRLWNRYTSTIERPQHQGINQSFRVFGSKTKVEGRRVRVFELNAHPITQEELNEFVSEEHRVDLDERWKTGHITLAEAKKRWPEWYQDVIVNGNERKGRWVVKEDLYNWWLGQICLGASFGHRYFCLMALAIYAVKCGITDRDRVRKDMENLVPFLNDINPDEPFGNDGEVDSAMEILDERYVTFPRDEISELTDIAMPVNKRNGRKQEQHMAVMRAIQDIVDPDGTWRNKDGRPVGSGTKRDMVCECMAQYPDATQREIAEILGISKTTVNKWAKEYPQWKVERRREE